MARELLSELACCGKYSDSALLVSYRFCIASVVVPFRCWCSEGLARLTGVWHCSYCKRAKAVFQELKENPYVVELDQRGDSALLAWNFFESNMST